jgi:TolB-like protein/DNA-binding winged helix-turn-helix (wHTH) protein
MRVGIEQAARVLFRFENFTLDSDTRELRRGDALIAIEPQVFDLLVFLIANRHRVISKDDLLGAVWSGRIVSESTLASRISAARRAIGDTGKEQRLIRTTIGKGVRFVGGACEGMSVDAAAPLLVPIPAPASPVRSNYLRFAPPPIQPTLFLPDMPSIAVLPFQNMSGDPEQEYFADGMIEEIITALSRIRWLFVIAHNSDVKQVGHELGVRYVLEGSIRKGGGRVRITAQLVDAETGAHLWADRFDGSLEEVFDLQDRVATSVAGVIEPALQAAETARSARRPTVDLTAYDLYLRATALFYSSSRLVPAALCLTEQAIARDPDYSNALALAALCYHRLLLDSTSQDRAADHKTGTELARRALQGPGDDPVTLSHAGFALGYFGEDINAMIAVVDRALSLNPCYARGWFHAGVLRMWSGQPDAAIEHVETSLRLSPRANIGVCNHVIGASHLLARRFDEALPKLVVAANEDPSFPNAHRYLASCYAHMGRLREASDVIRHLRTITPTVMPDASYLRHKEQRELVLSGLRLATGEGDEAVSGRD